MKNDTARYCYCKQQADDAMLQCAKCNDWFHIRCVGFLQKRGSGKKFRCAPCAVEFEADEQEENRVKEEAGLMEQAKAAVEKASKKKRKKKSDPELDDKLPSERLKKPSGAYFLFTDDFRPGWKAKHCDANGKYGIGDLAKAAGKAWAELKENGGGQAKYHAQVRAPCWPLPAAFWRES